MRTLNLWNAALAAMFVSGSALAADLPAVTPPPVFATGQWLLTVGVGPEVVNQFPGSKTYTVVPNGSISRWHPGEPEPFVAPDDGFTVELVDFYGFRAGPVARYISRRSLSNGNGNFFGLHDIGWSLELGGFAEYWIANMIRTHFEVRQAVNGNKGLEANLAFDYVQRMGPWTASIGPRFGYGNNTYMNSYFSVTPFEAAVNGRVTPFKASAGVDTVGGLATVRYDFTPAWNVTVYGGYNRLTSDAGASPISTNLGSRNQYIGGATVAYTFSWAGLGIMGF